MKTTTILSALMAVLLLPQVCIGQNVKITAFDNDSTITWSNAYPDGVAWVEQLTDVVGSDLAVTVTETMAISDGSSSIYNYTVEHPTIFDPGVSHPPDFPHPHPPTITISDGSNTWNNVTGSSNPTVLLGSVDYPLGVVIAIYLSNVPAAGTPMQVEYFYNPIHQEWLIEYAELPTSQVSQAVVTMSEDVAFYRVHNLDDHMVLIPAGSFQMGDAFNEDHASELPVHTVNISAFYIDALEVSKAKWDAVYIWAVANGYGFDNAGSGKAGNHPVNDVNWYDCVKWANARSEMDGLTPCYYTDGTQTTVYRTGQIDLANDWVDWYADGYRLPTEAEWEKAARGGALGRRFPWSDADTISHSRANYLTAGLPYDLSHPARFHPDYDNDPRPYTSPVGDFAPNDYGVYDMAGNVWEWCWDRYLTDYYASSPGTDPRGPASGSSRVWRGGAYGNYSRNCRVAGRSAQSPGHHMVSLGFRFVRAAQ